MFKTLTIYRFYIIYIFYNPYLLLIIIFILTPYLQFTAIQKIKNEIRPPVDDDIWEYYSKGDDNDDNGSWRVLKLRLGKGFSQSRRCCRLWTLDTGRIQIDQFLGGKRQGDRIRQRNHQLFFLKLSTRSHPMMIIRFGRFTDRIQLISLFIWETNPRDDDKSDAAPNKPLKSMRSKSTRQSPGDRYPLPLDTRGR